MCAAQTPLRVKSKMGSLSNRALLVNNLLDLALYARIRVVSAVGMKPPHDGRSRVRPPKVSPRSGSAATNPREWPRPRPGRDIEIRRVKDAQPRSTHCSTYGVTALSVGLNAVPDFHME